MKRLRFYCRELCWNKYCVKLMGSLHHVCLTQTELIELHCNSVPKRWGMITRGCQMFIPTLPAHRFQNIVAGAC